MIQAECVNLDTTTDMSRYYILLLYYLSLDGTCVPGLAIVVIMHGLQSMIEILVFKNSNRQSGVPASVEHHPYNSIENVEQGRPSCFR